MHERYNYNLSNLTLNVNPSACSRFLLLLLLFLEYHHRHKPHNHWVRLGNGRRAQSQVKFGPSSVRFSLPTMLHSNLCSDSSKHIGKGVDAITTDRYHNRNQLLRGLRADCINLSVHRWLCEGVHNSKYKKSRSGGQRLRDLCHMDESDSSLDTRPGSMLLRMLSLHRIRHKVTRNLQRLG